MVVSNNNDDSVIYSFNVIYSCQHWLVISLPFNKIFTFDAILSHHVGYLQVSMLNNNLSGLSLLYPKIQTVTGQAI